jgi:hypothetical protein
MYVWLTLASYCKTKAAEPLADSKWCNTEEALCQASENDMYRFLNWYCKLRRRFETGFPLLIPPMIRSCQFPLHWHKATLSTVMVCCSFNDQYQSVGVPALSGALNWQILFSEDLLRLAFVRPMSITLLLSLYFCHSFDLPQIPDFYGFVSRSFFQ